MRWQLTDFPDGAGTLRCALSSSCHRRRHVRDSSYLELLWDIETSGVYGTHIPFTWFAAGHGEGAGAAERNHHQGKESS